MTSNLGSGSILEGALDKESVKTSVMAAVRGHFRPEFINRVDELITFDPLDRAQVKSIVGLQVGADDDDVPVMGVCLCQQPRTRAGSLITPANLGIASQPPALLTNHLAD
jgi:hypothetical protein